VIGHQRRQQAPWNVVRAALGEEQEAILGHRGRERRAARLPVGEELVERPRVDDGAGQDVRADLRTLLEDAHRHLARACSRKLLEPDRRGEAGGSATDDHDVVIHRFACHGVARGRARSRAEASIIMSAQSSRAQPLHDSRSLACAR
jgi:hypothetical protein